MENALKLQLRWEKMSSKPKWRYILLEVVLQRFVLITVVVSLLNAILFQEFSDNFGKWISFVLLKLFLAGIVGILAGFLEWDFIKKLACKEYENIKAIGGRFILIYGLLSFSTIIAIALFKLPLEFTLSVKLFIIYVLAGLFYGFIMFSINQSGYKKYLKGQE